MSTSADAFLETFARAYKLTYEYTLRPQAHLASSEPAGDVSGNVLEPDHDPDAPFIDTFKNYATWDETRLLAQTLERDAHELFFQHLLADLAFEILITVIDHFDRDHAIHAIRDPPLPISYAGTIPSRHVGVPLGDVRAHSPVVSETHPSTTLTNVSEKKIIFEPMSVEKHYSSKLLALSPSKKLISFVDSPRFEKYRPTRYVDSTRLEALSKNYPQNEKRYHLPLYTDTQIIPLTVPNQTPTATKLPKKPPILPLPAIKPSTFEKITVQIPENEYNQLLLCLCKRHHATVQSGVIELLCAFFHVQNT